MIGLLKKDFKCTGNDRGGILVVSHNRLHAERNSLQTEFQAVAAWIYFKISVSVCSVYLHHNDDITSNKLTALSA